MNAHTTTPPLSPPAHIVGRLHGWTPTHIVDQRNAWAAEAAQNGATWSEIGRALGIGTDPARIAAQRAGYRAPKKNDRNAINNRVRKIGVKLGYFGTVFFGLPDDVQNKLIDMAIKRKMTVADALVAHFVEVSK